MITSGEVAGLARTPSPIPKKYWKMMNLLNRVKTDTVNAGYDQMKRISVKLNSSEDKAAFYWKPSAEEESQLLFNTSIKICEAIVFTWVKSFRMLRDDFNLV